MRAGTNILDFWENLLVPTKNHRDLKHYNVCKQINDKETFYSVFVYYSVVVVEGRVLTW